MQIEFSLLRHLIDSDQVMMWCHNTSRIMLHPVMFDDVNHKLNQEICISTNPVPKISPLWSNNTFIGPLTPYCRNLIDTRNIGSRM